MQRFSCPHCGGKLTHSPSGVSCGLCGMHWTSQEELEAKERESTWEEIRENADRIWDNIQNCRIPPYA